MFKLSRRESQGRENSVHGSCKSIMIKEPQILLVLVDGIHRIKDSVDRAWGCKCPANDKGIHAILGGCNFMPQVMEILRILIREFF